MHAIAVWAAVFGLGAATQGQDWPTLRGSPERTGTVDGSLPAGKPLRVWVRHFAGERLGSAMEPVVADGLVFVATHSGNLYALRSENGEPAWRFKARGPFLQSPACADGKVFAASTDGFLYGLEAATGKLIWRHGPEPGGFAASPCVVQGKVYIGSRTGEFLAVSASTGALERRVSVGIPFRQTAAAGDGSVFVTGEDLRVRRFKAAGTGEEWTSEPLRGQSARDFYPVLAKAGGTSIVVVRTNPVIHHPDRLSRDLDFLCKTSGIDNRAWKTFDSWMKSDEARGTPDLREKEQAAVVRHLEERPEARCFFRLDAETGKESTPAPVLWVGGCQGVPTPPVTLPDGRLQVFYRTAFTNWNHGVAPFVGLGAYDPAKNRIEPWFHDHGRQPPWNLFWGTADEAQNFLRVGDALLIVHQSTLSSFDLKTRKLTGLAGDRDGWGGFRNLPWARNEWNGPGRGGVAVVGKRLYWMTGSRLHAYEFGAQGKPADDAEIDGTRVAGAEAPEPPAPDLRAALAREVELALREKRAPLYTQPGIAGREFFFDESGEFFEALCRAYPHLEKPLQARVKERLAEEWGARPPFSKEAWVPLDEGSRRELFAVPKELLNRAGHEKPHPPFGGTYAAWLYARQLDEWDRVRAAWPALKSGFEDFAKSGWTLDPAKGHLFANRYLSSLLACREIAEKLGDRDTAARAAERALETAAALAAWWTRAAEKSELRVYRNIQEWDDFIVKGEEGLFFKVIPHNHKLALFYDLTPEVAAVVGKAAPEAVAKLWKQFEALCATWWIVGEEHQVHFGENFVDPPDFARDAFKAYAWLAGAPAERLRRRVDLPFCAADLYHVMKLAIACDPR